MIEMILQPMGTMVKQWFKMQDGVWSTEWRLGYNDMHGYEVETHLGRYIGKMQWFMPFIGFDYRYRKWEWTNTKQTYSDKRMKKIHAELLV